MAHGQRTTGSVLASEKLVTQLLLLFTLCYHAIVFCGGFYRNISLPAFLAIETKNLIIA